MPTATVQMVDAPFVQQFRPAGSPDEAVIAAHVGQSRHPVHEPRHQGVKRYPTATALFEDLELPLLEVEAVVHASCLQHTAVAALLRQYHCRPVALTPGLSRVLLRGIESRAQISPTEVLSQRRSPEERERFELSCQMGVTAWRLTFSNGSQLLYLQALHAPWSLLTIVSAEQAGGRRE